MNQPNMVLSAEKRVFTEELPLSPRSLQFMTPHCAWLRKTPGCLPTGLLMRVKWLGTSASLAVSGVHPPH